ncbi:MAG: hypothetical protein SFV52_16665 [Saprospiraceae bacterium]|nr:hypothetical protein [Saprospiraceae bacterium]
MPLPFTQPNRPCADESVHPGVYFVFKNRGHWLRYPMDAQSDPFERQTQLWSGRLDTLSNWYSRQRTYVEFVRQDHATQPTLGMALGFEFDETFGEYPYTPQYARLQLKNFTWGGVEFSLRDTFNYTGVSNEFSDDLSVEVDYFDGDSISGRFSGLLLSGAGPMAVLDSGTFALRLFRVD